MCTACDASLVGVAPRCPVCLRPACIQCGAPATVDEEHRCDACDEEHLEAACAYCDHPLWAPESVTRGYCDACRIEHGLPPTPARDDNPVADHPRCSVCGLGINPVFGVSAHYDCARSTLA